MTKAIQSPVSPEANPSDFPCTVALRRVADAMRLLAKKYADRAKQAVDADGKPHASRPTWVAQTRDYSVLAHTYQRAAEAEEVIEAREAMARRNGPAPVAQCPDRKGPGGCEDEGDGACRYCGVSLSECPTCHGVGYHVAGCAEVDPACDDSRGDHSNRYGD